MATTATTAATHAAPLTLPKEIMEVVAPTETFPAFRKKWLSNEEVVSLLISYNKHSEWLTTSMQERPPNGTVMLVNRKAVKYKKDGYCWKVRKDSTIIREDTMRLKIQCLEVLKCLYAHSSLVPTFHRRSYWLFINPDIVLVHYLNVNPEFTYSTLMGNPPALFTLPHYWPSSRPWSSKELLSELKPMYENCTNEDGTLQNGMKSVDELISLIMEARQNAASHDTISATPVKNTQSCKLNQCQKNVPLKATTAVEDPKSGKDKITDPGNVCEKFRPILASTGLNSKPIPLVLNIQPVLAVVQTKLAVNASSEASKSKPGVVSEDRVLKSVSETSTQTCSDIVHSVGEGANFQGVSVSYVQSSCSNIASGTSSADGGCNFTSSSISESSDLRKSPSRMFALSKKPGEEFVSKQCDYNFTSYVSNCNNSFGSPVQATSIITSNFAHGTTLLSPNSVFDSTGSPLESLSSCEHGFYAAAQPKYAGRSRSIGSDLGFSESIDFSPSIHCNNPSSVSTIMYDLVSPPPSIGSNKTKMAPATNGVPTGTPNVTCSSHNEPTYDLSCYHCDSFSSCGQASSVGGINSSGSSNSVLTEHTNMSENMPSTTAPLSLKDSVLGSLQPPYNREPSQDPYIPDFSSTSAVQGFSEMADLSHHGGDLAEQNEVFTSADLPDLSSMAGFNEQMCRLAPDDSLPTTANAPSSTTANHFAESSQGFVPQMQMGSSVPPPSTHMLTFVTEYSPNWCYEEGGEKILVAGNWLELNSNDSFQCQFGEKLVPAALILPGVLRCLSPDYSQGIVPLSVLRNGAFLTHSVPFEYRSRPNVNDLTRGSFDVNNESDWLALDDRQFRYRLLTRLNQMHSHLTRLVGHQFGGNGGQVPNGGGPNMAVDEICPSAESLSNFEMAFEQKFVAILQIISQVQQTCVGKPLLELPRPARGLTMLHLAAALGMPRLIDMMRSSVSQLGGMSDVNPASLDDEHCSPLTWACARGNLECTLILHNWCHEMLHARNRLGLTPAMIAKQRGHILLVETLTEQVTGNSRNYKSARGKRPCPININERDTQTSNGHKPGSTLLDFSFMPTSQQDSMSSSCSEYDSEDNCSLSSNALGEFGGMTLSEIEQLAFNEGIGGTRSGSHAQTNSPSNAHAKSMANGAPLDSMSSVGHRFESSQGAADDADESDSDMDLSRSCSPYITTSLQVYNLAQQIIRAIPERIKRSDCQESQEVRDEFELGGAGGGARNRLGGQNCWCRDHCSSQTAPTHAQQQSHDPSPPMPCCSRGGTAASWSICSSFDLLSDELDNDQMSECGGGGAFGLSPDPCTMPGWSSSTGSTFRGDSQGVLHDNGGFEAPMEDLKEFIQGRGNVEAELNSLTLTDRDQRTLYESAKIIQSAFRQYKQCREKRRQEIAAAILIQSYFRKYKQYFSYKRMCRAARLIQKVFRRYKYNGTVGATGILTSSPGASNIQHDRRATLRASALAELNNNKLFPQNRVTAANSFIGYLSRHDVDQAVLLVQRNYRRKAKRRRENDAALKIQRFLRQCKNKIQTLRNNGAGNPTPMMWSFVR